MTQVSPPRCRTARKPLSVDVTSKPSSLTIEDISDVPAKQSLWFSRRALIDAILRHRAYLHYVAQREIGRDLDARGEASDLVQETCLEALRDLDKFHGTSEGEFLCWMRRILIHNVRSFARRRRALADREVSVDPRRIDLEAIIGDAGAHCPCDAAMVTERLQKLREALDRLPDRARQSVLMRSRDDRTFREIGEHLGCSAVAARKLWLRVRERLRHELRAC